MPLIHITHDGPLDIATGRSRRETNWKNKETQWSELVAKLSTTHRTAENYQEYLSSKKVRQDEIKDIGGFVGGYLNGGRRKSGNVLHRQLVTLDIDFASADIWDDFLLTYGNAAALYSTHKHGPESPRYRLVIPLDRTVLSDEYIAIARRIAGVLGIEYFDPTTYQPQRLMYWPSTAKDGDFVFEYQDGPWMSADGLLASYHDWRDSSEWPMSERENNTVSHAIKKQGDPLEKPGVIGAFCRTYTIEETIELFLSDVYTECDIPGRYTYKEGSTSGGLVVYESKYAYSHHGTDPVSGKLCNAFDLVRLHKYGLKDEDVREGTPGNKLPSYTAMIEFGAKDPKVRKLLGAERLQDARSDFAGILDEEISDEPVNDDWLAEMDVDKKGNYYSTIDNIVLILKNDPRLKGCFALNTFEQREILKRSVPWRKVTDETRYMTDKDDAGIRHYIEKTYGISNISKTKDALDIILSANSFHPLKDYLNSLSWDGESRVDTLFIDYLGADDNEYVRAVTRKALVAAIARIYKPGTKFDNMLTLVGSQGIGKSTILNKLGGVWFSDSFNFHLLGKKDAFEQLQGAWIIEVGELTGLKKADIEGAKNFLSKREDRYRVAFGKRNEYFPRQTVFFGSTNNQNFLRDATGNRRFWPVQTMVQSPTKNVFIDFTEEERGQVWAEAIELYKQKEPLYLSARINAIAESVQTDYAEKDDRVGMIQKYLDTKLPDEWDQMDIFSRRAYLAGDELQPEGKNTRGQVCAAEIWCEVLGGTTKDMHNQNTKFIHDIMQNLPGWGRGKATRKFGSYGYQRAYFRIENTLKTTKK